MPLDVETEADEHEDGDRPVGDGRNTPGTGGEDVERIAGTRDEEEAVAGEEGDTFDILAPGAEGVPPIAYRAVPVLVLVGLGFSVQWHFARSDRDPLGTALNVVGLTAGYVVMAALATFVFVTTTNRGEPVAFPLLPTVILTALYALAFGVIGAALGAAIDRWRALR